MKRWLIAALLFMLVVPAAAQAAPPTGKWNTSPQSSTTMSISRTDQSPTVPTGLRARMYVRKGATCRDSTKPGQTTIRFLREELYGVPIRRSGRRFFVNTRHPKYHANDRSETLTTVNGTFSQRDTILRLKAHLSLTSGTTKCSTDYQVTLRRSR